MVQDTAKEIAVGAEKCRSFVYRATEHTPGGGGGGRDNLFAGFLRSAANIYIYIYISQIDFIRFVYLKKKYISI